MNYDKLCFLAYVFEVVKEMKHRKINYNNDFFDEIFIFCNPENNWVFYEKINNYPEHNDRYLKQCYYNLQEKYDRGIITKEEYDKIKGIVKI